METQKDFEFIYLGFKKESKLGTRCIYDVEVIQPNQVDFDDYFTMSRDGITRYSANSHNLGT